MKQALLLCGGEARRLRPYSHSRPKAAMPFLNLPLLSLSWFYMEQLGVSHFHLNSYLFPEKLKEAVQFLSKSSQKTRIFREDKLFGGAGALYHFKKDLQKSDYFFYINGDSLFFPSSLSQILEFEKTFLEKDLDACFFVAPLKKSQEDRGALFSDNEGNVKFIGKKQNLPQKLQSKKLSSFYFSGLAVMKSSLLKNLKREDFHLFDDFVEPLFGKKKIQVFEDKEASILEGGEVPAYLEAMDFCLKCLFETKAQSSKKKGAEKEEIVQMLTSLFSRFDPNDEIVGFENGRLWAKKLGYPLLAAKSVKGLENLRLKGPVVLGPSVRLLGKSLLAHSVLGSKIQWRGDLEKKILLKTEP